MNRGLYGLSTQAVNGLGTLEPPGQSVGLYARLIPWLQGVPNGSSDTAISFSPRPYVVIGADPMVTGNNGANQFTGLALQLPTFSSAFVTIPATTDSNYTNIGLTTAVGAARGQGAVDVQTYRNSSAQVANGQFATAVGQQNIASGQNSVAVGTANSASGSQSAAIGNSNTASGAQSTAVGYVSNAQNTGASAFGYNCTASGSLSFAAGYVSSTTLTQSSAIGTYASSTFAYSLSLSANRFSSSGDSQLIFARQSYQTTTATATQLFGDNTSGASRLNIAFSTSYAYKLQLVARQTGGTAGTAGDTAVWNIQGGVYRAAAGNTVLLGATTTSYSAVTAAAAWTATVSADTINQALVVTVAGEANKNINWVAFWQLVRSA